METLCGPEHLRLPEGVTATLVNEVEVRSFEKLANMDEAALDDVFEYLKEEQKVPRMQLAGAISRLKHFVRMYGDARSA